MKLSILVATISERADSYFPNLTKELMRQIGDRKDIEIVGLMDNRRRSIGVKRQNLLNLAQGEYLVYFDDDDTPAPDYVPSIMAALDSAPGVDAVAFQVQYTNLGTGENFLCKYDKDERGRGKRPDGTWHGPICHIHVIRSAVARTVRWLEAPKGSQWTLDATWASAVVENIKTQVKIDRPLYLYNYDPRISETLKRNHRIDGR